MNEHKSIIIMIVSKINCIADASIVRDDMSILVCRESK